MAIRKYSLANSFVELAALLPDIAPELVRTVSDVFFNIGLCAISPELFRLYIMSKPSITMRETWRIDDCKAITAGDQSNMSAPSNCGYALNKLLFP